MYLESVAQIFRLFPVQIVGHNSIRAFLRESGRSCSHVFNSWDLGQGKKQTSVLAMLRNKAAPSALLPDSRRGGAQISSSISGSNIKTLVFLI